MVIFLIVLVLMLIAGAVIAYFDWRPHVWSGGGSAGSSGVVAAPEPPPADATEQPSMAPVVPGGTIRDGSTVTGGTAKPGDRNSYDLDLGFSDTPDAPRVATPHLVCWSPTSQDTDGAGPIVVAVWSDVGTTGYYTFRIQPRSWATTRGDGDHGQQHNRWAGGHLGDGGRPPHVPA